MLNLFLKNGEFLESLMKKREAAKNFVFSGPATKRGGGLKAGQLRKKN